jgi:transposase-like protein
MTPSSHKVDSPAIPGRFIIERSFREVRLRTRPIGCFNNVDSCERIIYAVLIYLNAQWEVKPLPQFAHNT